VQKDSILTVEDGVRLTALKEFNAHSDGKKAKKRVRVEVGKPSQRRFRRCSKAGHNSRMCKQGVAIDSELNRLLEFLTTVVYSTVLL
jgi:hypothetical protein